MRLTFPHAMALVAAVLVVLTLGASARAAGQCREAAESAQDLRKANKLREARAQLLVCAGKSCKEPIKSDCEKWLKEVDEITPSIIVRAVDASGKDVLGVRVTIDETAIELDGAPVQVDPGQRTIRARAKSGDVAEQKTLVAQGEKNRVIEIRFTKELAQDGTSGDKTAKPPKPPPETDAKPPPAEGGSNVVPITLAAIGGVSLATFAYFQIAGHSSYGDLENGCAKTSAGCTDNDIDPVKTKFVAAGISLGIAVVALGAAAVVYFTSSSKTASFRPFSPVLRF